MLFHSFSYAALLTSTVLLCGLVPARSRWVVLLLASCAFYWAWRVEYLGLLLITALTCHVGAVLLDHNTASTAWKQLVLTSVVVANLAILFLFKYYGLFAQSLTAVSGVEFEQDLGFLLPVGISFYTFQAIGYVMDVYLGKLPAEKSLLRTTLFIAFFPQLVAGPIERARHLMPALRAPITFRWRNARIGLWLILWGLFKKVVIADRLSLLVDHAYSVPSETSGFLLLLATYAFAFQIYCDFSGYTDMAIGSARIFGVDLMRNFRLPYRATSLRDFWSRWHISLSTWFRDYLYIPLGGNRVSGVRWTANIIIVFGLSGLWHGAQWTYAIWGLIHGLGVVVETLLGKLLLRLDASGKFMVQSRWLRCLLTFHIVLLAWVFFRAESLKDAALVLSRVFTWADSSWPLAALTGLPLEFSRFELAVSILGLSWMVLIEEFARWESTVTAGPTSQMAASRGHPWDRCCWC